MDVGMRMQQKSSNHHLWVSPPLSPWWILLYDAILLKRLHDFIEGCKSAYICVELHEARLLTALNKQ
jgi:hypothetical protein